MSSSDDVRDKFSNTNFEKQNKMLLRSLQLCAGATSGDPAALREMDERAITHGSHHLNIEPRLYDLWLEAIVTAAGDHDDEWNDEVDAAWRRILGFVIQHMIRKYENDEE